MQPSILRFFKAKQPDEQSADRDKRATGENKKPEATPTKQLPVTTAKRPAEEWNSDDDDDVVKTKKQAIASTPPWTPTKGEKKLIVESEASKVPTVSTPTQGTPTKQQAPQPTKMATPLIDVSVVIRKKISCGAYALHENIGISWFRALQGEFDKPYFKKLSSFVQQERKAKTVFPPEDKVYSWTHHHDIKETRVVILGQDPYHAPGQAHGLSFSVQKGVRLPPSLVNIYKELENDIPGFKSPSYGDLTGWAKQGVLMLNTCLTVNQGQANSHQGKGWETFTDAVITWISKNSNKKVAFLLWGKPAQKKTAMIDKRHKILTSAHPSPLSAHNGFFGCSHFSQTNSFLRDQGLPEIDWKSL